MMLGAFFSLALVVGTWRDPQFWLTADQRGERLFRQKKFAEAAKVYTDPWRIGMAQYRDGDFAAAAKIFARVPGADGAFNQGNAWLMHGNYDAAIESYKRALGFRAGWKEAEENRALAAARKAQLAASGKDRDQEQTGDRDEMTPDAITFDQKPGDDQGQPVQINGGQMSDEDWRAAWLRRVQTTPADFLRVKFAYQAAQVQPKETKEKTK